MDNEKLIYRPEDFQGNPISVALDRKMLTDEGLVQFKRLALKGQPRDAAKDYAVKYDSSYVYGRFERMLTDLDLVDHDSIDAFLYDLRAYLGFKDYEDENESPL